MNGKLIFNLDILKLITHYQLSVLHSRNCGARGCQAAPKVSHNTAPCCGCLLGFFSQTTVQFVALLCFHLHFARRHKAFERRRYQMRSSMDCHVTVCITCVMSKSYAPVKWSRISDVPDICFECV